MQSTLEDRIRDRAYFISQPDGGAGDDRHFWLMAEREVLAEIAAEPVAAEVAAASVTEVAAEPAAEVAVAAPSRRSSEVGETGEADCHAPDNGNDEGRGEQPEEGCIEVALRERLGEISEDGSRRCSGPNCYRPLRPPRKARRSNRPSSRPSSPRLKPRSNQRSPLRPRRVPRRDKGASPSRTRLAPCNRYASRSRRVNPPPCRRDSLSAFSSPRKLAANAPAA